MVLVDLLQQPRLPLHHGRDRGVHDGEVAPSLHQLQKLLLEGGQRVDQIPVVLLPHEVVAPGLEEPARVLEPELELPGQASLPMGILERLFWCALVYTTLRVKLSF